MRNKFVLLIIAIIPLAACSLTGWRMTLSDSLIEKYIRAYPRLRAAGPSLIGADGTITPDKGAAAQDTIERIVREEGFGDFAQFMKVQVTIGAAMSVVENELYAEKMERHIDDMGDEKKYEEGFKGLLNNPDIPESSKEQVRQGIRGAREQANQGRAMFRAQKKVADAFMKPVGIIANDGDVALVRKHHTRLREAMTGFRADGTPVNY